MPLLKIVTNLTKSEIPKDFALKATAKMIEWTGRPEFTIQIIIQTDQILCLAGSQDGKIAFVNLMDINPDTETRPQVAKALHDFIVKELGLESDRFFIAFTNMPSTDDVARGGKLITQLIKELSAQGVSFERKKFVANN